MNISPLSISKSVWYFIFSSLVIYIGLYFGTPILLKAGINFFAAYLIFFHIPLFLLLITAFILFKAEGNNFSWDLFKHRIWLTKMHKVDWIWAIGLFCFGIIIYILLEPIGKILAHHNFFAPPDFFPAEINPNKSMKSGYMMDYKLSGQYCIAVLYFFAWITNILGEEFLFRGMLLRRQIVKYGSKAWIYHGVIWTLWHFFWKWNLFSILPFGLALSYTIYKRENIWIGIIAHGMMNSIPFILILIEVFK
jgi:membrane protease YdiL (CAAX protease family)